jgi:hypothetical protein
MQTKLIEVRVRHAEELRRWWLGGFPDGGIFLPEVTDLPAGTRVLVEVLMDEPILSSMLLAGTIAWRQPRNDDSFELVDAVLPPGVGVRFEPSMRDQVLFLQREMRGEASESRRGLRFPAHLASEVVSLTGAFDAEVVDVGPRGLRLLANDAIDLEPSSAVGVSVAQDGEVVTLLAHVAWVDPQRSQLGLCLALETTYARMQWASVLMSASEAAAFS